ncbi:MAG: thiamine pyrophosphate-dependent enzyme [Acetobacteraceae bacterium]
MNGKRRLIGSFWHGSTGDAMTRAVGAQLAFPGRQVISLSSDGDISMLMGDLQRLAQLKLPVKIVVLNDGALGGIEKEQHATAPPLAGPGLNNPSFAKLAEAAGIRGVRLEDPVDVDEGIRSALLYNGPAIIDVVVARTGFPAGDAEAAMNAELYTRRAVVNAKGNRLIDLANAHPWADL